MKIGTGREDAWLAQASNASIQNIHAAVLRKRGGPLQIESLEMEGPRDDEVLVRIAATGICHTDMDLCNDWDRTAMPVVLGHEGAGLVERVGAAVKGVMPGDHVVLSYQSCGHCPSCRNGRPMDCLRFYEANFGFKRLDGTNALQRSGVYGHFFGQSSFATHSLATERNLVKVPKNLPLEVLAPLGCGIQTGAGAVMNSLDVRAGASIAIFGTGAVGLAAVMAARIMQADPVICIDINPMRLELALELGATHTINNRHDDITSGIKAITGGGVDYVLEITGDPGMLQLAIDALNPLGVLALIADPGGCAFVPEGRKAIGIIQGDSVPKVFIPELILLYQSGRFPFNRFLRFYDFSEINQAVADAKNGETIKPVLRVS